MRATTTVLLLLTLVHPGCAPEVQECTELGCDDAQPDTVYFAQSVLDADTRDLADGVWRFELEVDDRVLVCSGTAPYWEDTVCDPGLQTYGDIQGDPYTPGSWEAHGGPSVVGLTLAETPLSNRFALRVEHDGIVVLDDSFEAAITEAYYPNGPECDPEPCGEEWRAEVGW